MKPLEFGIIITAVIVLALGLYDGFVTRQQSIERVKTMSTIERAYNQTIIAPCRRDPDASVKPNPLDGLSSGLFFSFRLDSECIADRIKNNPELVAAYRRMFENMK